MRALAIGAGSEQAASIIACRSLGINVLALDGRSNAEAADLANSFIQIDLRNVEDILSIVTEYAPDFVVPAPLAKPLITVGIINDRLGLKGVNESAARLVNDKEAMSREFRKAGVPMPRQVSIDTLGDLRCCAKFLSLPIILKPRCGSGSRGVILIRGAEDIPSVLAPGQWLIEEAIDGEEVGVDGAILNGEIRLLSIRKKMLTDPPYRQALSYFAIDPQVESSTPVIISAVEKAFSVLKCDNVLFHADIIIRKNTSDIYLIELSPRPAGHAIHSVLLPKCFEESIMEWFLHSVVVGHETRAPIFKKSAYLSFLEAPEGKVVTTPDFSDVRSRFELVDIYCDLRKGDVLGPIIDGASALKRGFLAMQTADINLARQIAREIASCIVVEE